MRADIEEMPEMPKPRPVLAPSRTALAAAALLIAGLAAPLHAGPQNPTTPSSAKTLSLGVAVSGVVQNILVQDGVHVDAGQLLLQIDCRPLEVELKVRAADRAAAEAAYERTRNGSRLDEIAIGEANVGVARARAEEARDADARVEALTLGVSVTRADLLTARRDARVTAAQLDDAIKRLALLQAGSRVEDIAEFLARRDVAAAQLDLAQARLDQCSLRAPVPGTVQFVATLGQFISVAVPETLVRLTPDKPTQ
jgi:multidrug resistance efflux pump